jgi:hypothetical protein
MLPTPGAIEQTVSKEASPQEGSASPDDGVGPSQVLVHVGSVLCMWEGPWIKSTFSILDDIEEARN